MIRKNSDDSSPSSHKLLFYQGKYAEFLSRLGPLSGLAEEWELFPLVVGALIFRGQFEEAEVVVKRIELHLARRTKTEEEDDLLLATRFFQIIGFVRRSQYHNAREFVRLNLISARQTRSEKSRFFAFQGAAFFNFYQGKSALVVRQATQAFAAAFSNDFSYGQILSLDLLGHAFCLLGQVQRGIFDLERALALATDLGNGGVATALQVSLVKFKAAFGLDPLTTIEEITHALKVLRPEDTYSKAELKLELVRQLLLRGQGDQAAIQLEKVGPLVYRHRNLRQSALFNFRTAYLYCLKGDAFAAQTLLQSSIQLLNPQVDGMIIEQFNGLIKEIDNHLRTSSFFYEASLKSHFVSFRIAKRKNAEMLHSQSSLSGQDPLGDLLDEVARDGIKAIDKIKRLKLWGLVPKALGVHSWGLKAIVLGPDRNEGFIIDGANVTPLEQVQLTKPLLQIIGLLNQNRFVGKEEIIEKVWKHSYRPLDHDNLVYNSMTRWRKILGGYASWLEWNQEGYRLQAGVQVVNLRDESTQNLGTRGMVQTLQPAKIDIKDANNLRPSSAWSGNIRQLKFLRATNSLNEVSVREYAKIFEVTSMTAFRDLNDLVQQGHLQRIGRGRSTVYLRTV